MTKEMWLGLIIFTIAYFVVFFALFSPGWEIKESPKKPELDITQQILWSSIF